MEGIVNMNKKDFNNISMNGRIAYQLMCVERYFTNKYPEKDFTKLFELLWPVTNGMYWDKFSGYITELEPSYMLEFNSYEENEWGDITKEQYEVLKPIISGLDETDEAILETLKEQAEVYAYTVVPENTKESIDIIFETIEFLKNESIKLPELSDVSFSTINQFNGWGNPFDGTKLSIVLNK